MKPIIPYLMKLANLFLFSAGVYYSVCYLFFVDVPETFFVIISIILLVFSLGSFFIIVNQLIKDEQKSLFLIFTYSSINISLLFSVIYFLIDYVYTSEINQQLLTHLGIQNIIVLHFILLFFFALSLFYQVKPTDCSNCFSYLSIAAIILLFGSTIYFAFIANPNRLFKNQTTDISSLKLILCSPFSGACQIHKEYEDPKEIRKILSMFEINWWNSIFRNLSGVAGKPIIELSTPDKTIILEFSPYNITFFDQIGEFTLTDSSRIKITDFLTGLSK